VAIEADDIKDAILTELGDIDPVTGNTPAAGRDGIVADQIDYLWERHAAKDLVAPELRELYVKAACIELILGVLDPRLVDTQDNAAGLGIKGSQVIASYERKLARIQDQIEKIERLAMARHGGTIKLAQMANTQPKRPQYPPNPSSQRYGGTAFRRRTRAR
jgi:hypothetical protein